MPKLTPDQRAALLQIVATETRAAQSLEFVIGRTDDDVYVAPLIPRQTRLAPLVILPDWLDVWKTRGLIVVGSGLSGLPAGDTFVLTAEAHAYARLWALPAWRRWLREEWDEFKPEWRGMIAAVMAVIVIEILKYLYALVL
jgi:hypothetical protein